MQLIGLCVFLAFSATASASTLAAPPKSAVIVAFENEYDLSLLANTLSDQGVDSTLIVTSLGNDLYENLVDVEVVKVEVEEESSNDAELKALEACERLLRDENISKRVEEIQPTFVIFPALRHDACLLPWTQHFKSIPVIWAQGPNSEFYAFLQSGVALPIHAGGIWSRISTLLFRKSMFSKIENNYIIPASNIVKKYLPNAERNLGTLYSDVDLVFWGADPILRSQFAPLSQLLVDIGCHHCRGAHPLSANLQKELIDYRLGTIAVLLDEKYSEMVQEIARNLPQGRQGQAVVWKNKNVKFETGKPENLFVHDDIIRQDLIGFPRTRVLLSHCDDTELLETAFHGTPVICFPRNSHEFQNEIRAIELGFSHSTQGDFTPKTVLSAITHVHETTKYRENARKISAALRDRPNPAMDRIIYWLEYLSRNREEQKFLAHRSNRNIPHRQIFNIDLSLTTGFIIGTALGALLPFAYFLAIRILASNQDLQSRNFKLKKKYKS